MVKLKFLQTKSMKGLNDVPAFDTHEKVYEVEDERAKQLVADFPKNFVDVGKKLDIPKTDKK